MDGVCENKKLHEVAVPTKAADLVKTAVKADNLTANRAVDAKTAALSREIHNPAVKTRAAAGNRRLDYARRQNTFAERRFAKQHAKLINILWHSRRHPSAHSRKRTEVSLARARLKKGEWTTKEYET